VVTISRPQMGEIVSAGQPITVNWQSLDNKAVATQSLLLSLDGGVTFQTVSSFGAETSTFTLNNLPNLEKTTARAEVKIEATDTAGNRGEKVVSFTIGPALTQASFTKPKLIISGIGFTSTNSQAAVTIFINEKTVATTRVAITSNTAITVTGNKKKLNLVKGSNSVRVVVDGVSSNLASFLF